MLLIALASLVTTAVGQDYRVDKPDETMKRNSGAVISSVKNAARYTADKDKFEEYFVNYYFKDMTRSGADELARLGDARYNLFKRYLWATDNEELQRHLTDLAFKGMRQIVVANKPPYHPAVRYNAVLTLGMLDEQYAIETGANRRPPRPHAAARGVLMQIVTAAAEDKVVPPVLVLGALVGLERHAQYPESIEPATIDVLTGALVKLVNHERPIQEMDRETFDWLRLRAAGVLAQLGGVGPKNEVHDALIKLVAGFKSLDDRTATAALLDKMKYEGAKVDAAAAVEQLFKLARDVGEAEAKRAEEFESAHVAGGGFGPRGAERFMPAGMQGERETFPRRHVLARLTDLRAGLQALKKIVPEDNKPKIDEVLSAIEPARSAAADKDTVELKLTAAIHTMAAAVDRAAAPAEKPADEIEVEEAFEAAASGQ
ncbi:MAG: hypothetical protein WD738_07030 [Pirellulales bacterium]